MRADRYKESDRHGRSTEQKETNKGKHIVRAAVPVALLLIVVVAGIVILPEYRAVDKVYCNDKLVGRGDLIVSRDVDESFTGRMLRKMGV